MSPITVLHVDDDEAFAELVATALDREGAEITVTTALDGAAALEHLETAGTSVDCIVSDYDMPGMNGLELLEAVRDRRPRLPFVLFTGKGSEEIASAAISAGVSDYLQKGGGLDQFTVLANRVKNVVRRRHAEASVEAQIAQQEAVATLGRHALDGAPLEELFDTAAGFVCSRLGTDYASILEQCDDGAFVLRAARGWDDELVGTATVSADDDSQAGYTLRSGSPVVVTDFDGDERFSSPTCLPAAGVTSGLSVPIGRPSAPWGVLAGHTVASRSFSENEVSFVRALANVLAGAIDRKRTERELRRSEERFREIAELSLDAVFRATPAGVLEYVSPASRDIVGYTPVEMVGTHFGEYVHEEDRERAAERYAQALAGEVVRGVSLTLVDADGKPVRALVDARPVTDDGEVVAVQGFVHDRDAETVSSGIGRSGDQPNDG